EAADPLQVDTAHREQRTSPLQDAVQQIQSGGAAEGLVARQPDGEPDRVRGADQVLLGARVVGGDAVGHSRGGAGQILLLQSLERSAVSANEHRLGHGEGNERGQDQGEREENEEADPTSTGAPVHDNDIIAAASSHSSGGTSSTITGSPIADSSTAAA